MHIHSEKLEIILLVVMALVGIFLLPKYYSNAIYCGLAFPLGVCYEMITCNFGTIEKDNKYIISLLSAVLIYGLIIVFFWRKSYLLNNISAGLLAIMLIFIAKGLLGTFIANILYWIGCVSFEVYLLEHLIMFSEVNLIGRLGNNLTGFLSVL